MSISPKYRSLTTDELQGLEQEFIEYLVVNGIMADEWVELKAEQQEKAEDIITLFSDVVFEGIMRKVQFLDFVSAGEIKTFQCLPNKMIMMGMTSDDPKHDFTNAAFIAEAAHKAPEGIKYLKGEKPYSKQREIELFEMTTAGCLISDGKLFKTLAVTLT